MTGAARVRLLVAAVFALGAAGMFGWWLFWRASAETMREAIDAWAEDQREDGASVAYDRIRTKGFPFYLRGDVENLSFTDPGGWRWSVAVLHVDALPYAPERRILSASNPQAIDLGKDGLWSLDAERARISFDKPKDRKWIVDIESGPGVLARADGSRSLKASRFLFSIAPRADDPDRIEASLAVEGLRAAFGAEPVEAARIEAFIEVGDRDSGREITIKRFAALTEGSDIVLDGAVRFDDQDRLDGIIDADIGNPAGLAVLLRKVGALSAGEAEQTGAALSLAAIASGGRLKAPIVLKDGAATIAGVRIATIPSID